MNKGYLIIDSLTDKSKKKASKKNITKWINLSILGIEALPSEGLNAAYAVNNTNRINKHL